MNLNEFISAIKSLSAIECSHDGLIEYAKKYKLDYISYKELYDNIEYTVRKNEGILSLVESDSAWISKTGKPIYVCYCNHEYLCANILGTSEYIVERDYVKISGSTFVEADLCRRITRHQKNMIGKMTNYYTDWS